MGTMGPNMKRLIAMRMSAITVPPGGGVASVVAVLTTPGRLAAVAKEASEWSEQAVAVVRSASDPNPWKTASDEDIAGELLRVAAERKVG